MFCEMIIDYFERAAEAPMRELEPITTNQQDAKGGYQKQEVRRICAELPTLEGFARSIQFSACTLIKWARLHEDFGEAYARAKDIQKMLLIDRGLNRQYDATALIFVAKNITDMTDKQVLAGDPDAPLTVKSWADVLRERRAKRGVIETQAAIEAPQE